MLTTTKTLRVFANPHEAEIMRTRLDAAGILTVINGAEVAFMLSHIGTAVAKVRLEVAPEDFDRAIAVLDEDERRRGELSDWECVRCDEENDASFDLCWSCSKKRDESDPLPQGTQTPGKMPDETQWSSVTVDPATAMPRIASTNPYAPTTEFLERSRSHVQTTSPDEPDEEMSAQVKRIFYGSVFGFALLPPLLSLYVVYMLTFQVSGQTYHYAKFRWRLIASWILSAISIVLWLLLYMSQLGF